MNSKSFFEESRDQCHLSPIVRLMHDSLFFLAFREHSMIWKRCY